MQKAGFCLSPGINLTLRDKFKSCDTYFYIFHQKKALKNYKKCFFILLKKFCSFSRYLNFCTCLFPAFPQSAIAEFNKEAD